VHDWMVLIIVFFGDDCTKQFIVDGTVPLDRVRSTGVGSVSAQLPHSE